jgi:integrase
LASNLVAGLEREWNEMLFSVPNQLSVFDFLTKQPVSEPVLSEARLFYCEMKGKADNKRFVQYTSRVVAEVIGLSGDKIISAYTRHDALAFRDSLLDRNSSYATVKRNFECIRAVWNFAARENGINSVNPFANMNYGNGAAPVKRMSIPIEDIRKIQSVCLEMDDDIRWLIALLSDTGMRLAEACGLFKQDIHLDGERPFIRLFGHQWRRLKTAGSQRDIPLVGASLWAAQRALENTETQFLFPRYCNEEGCKADHASNTLNKWLKEYVPRGCVMHSFRHSMRDRLRAVECPSDVIDQIGGWKAESVGKQYGEGYSLGNLAAWMMRL